MNRIYPKGKTEHDLGDIQSVQCAVITVSDTRDETTDRSGAELASLLRGAGHSVVQREIVPDGPERLGPLLTKLQNTPEIQAILITGGTGLDQRDQTPQIVSERLSVEMPGFGEMFRAISVAEIGPRAILSRAIAGRMGQQAIFVMPGSTGAVRTAMEKIILPILGHVAGQIRRPSC